MENSDEKENGEETDERKSVNSVSCKICFDSGKDEDPITPCWCKGSIGKVHLSCLEKWLAMTNSTSCELCGFRFNVTRNPRFRVVYSVYFWLFKDEAVGKQALIDLCLFLFLIAPIFFALMFVCLAFATVNQSPQGYTWEFWTQLILTVSAVMIAFGLYIWASTALTVHSRSWLRWWQSQNVVRIHNIRPKLTLTHFETAFV